MYLLKSIPKKGSTKHNKNGTVWASKGYIDTRSKKEIWHNGKAEDIHQLCKEALSPQGKHWKGIKLHKVDDKEAALIKEKTGGLNVTGFSHGIDTFSIRHIIKEHGNKEREEAKGQIAIQIEDIEKIPEIISNPDNIVRGAKTGLGLNAIKYSKRFDGIIIYVEEVQEDDKVLLAKTMFKKKAPVPRAISHKGRVANTSKTIRSSSKKNIPPSIIDVKLKKSISLGLYLLRKSRPLHGRMDFNGLKISIENRKGSIRQWHNPDNGTAGTTRMRYPYGYIRMTEGVDGDHVDCYVGPHRDAPFVYIVHQMKAPEFKEYDEDKVMMGFLSKDEAKQAYLDHYDDSRFLGSMTRMPFEEFKEKILGTKDNPQRLQDSGKQHYHDARDRKGQYTRHGSLGHMIRRLKS